MAFNRTGGENTRWSTDLGMQLDEVDQAENFAPQLLDSRLRGSGVLSQHEFFEDAQPCTEGVGEIYLHYLRGLGRWSDLRNSSSDITLSASASVNPVSASLNITNRPCSDSSAW